MSIQVSLCAVRGMAVQRSHAAVTAEMPIHEVREKEERLNAAVRLEVLLVRKQVCLVNTRQQSKLQSEGSETVARFSAELRAAGTCWGLLCINLWSLFR